MPHRLPICYETMVTIAHLQGAGLLGSSLSDMKEVNFRGQKRISDKRKHSSFQGTGVCPKAIALECFFFFQCLFLCLQLIRDYLQKNLLAYRVLVEKNWFLSLKNIFFY